MNFFDSIVEELKKEKNIPLFIYGAGMLAERLFHMLSEDNGIEISGFIIDKQYLPSSTAQAKPLFCNKPLIGFNDTMLEKKYNLIIGFMDISEKKLEILKKDPNINRVYHRDFSSMQPAGTLHILDEIFLHEHMEEYYKLYNELADFESKRAMILFIVQKLTGTAKKEFSENKQYFDKDIFKPSENEVFVDCGAYNGDTVIAFREWLNNSGIEKWKKIIAFEADTNNFEEMKKNLQDYENTELLPMGVWDKDTILHFNNEGSISSGVTENGIEISVTTIDNAVKNENVTFIKMDIEGSELRALQGAAETIRRCRPKLAICIYHKKEDMIEIPKYIKSLSPDYKFYLRSYDEHAVETVLYAI